MNRRRWLMLVSMLIVAAVAVLAASLHDVHFEPGTPLTFDNPSNPAMPGLPVTEMLAKPPLWKVLLFWAAFAINVLLFFWLLPPEVRKRILRQMLSLLFGTLALILALRYRLIHLPFLDTPVEQEPNPIGTGAGGNTPLPKFTPPEMAPWWVFAVSFLVLAAVLLGLFLAYRWWVRQAAHRFSDLASIRDIARSSLADLASGKEWNDVIIQSYVRMNDAVSARRGLERGHAVTPREFAQRLQEAGLPANEVARLTRLFEAARYGGRQSTQADINEAVACLNSILQACGQAL